MMDIDQIRIALWIIAGCEIIRTAYQLIRFVAVDICKKIKEGEK